MNVDIGRIGVKARPNLDWYDEFSDRQPNNTHKGGLNRPHPPAKPISGGVMVDPTTRIIMRDGVLLQPTERG